MEKKLGGIELGGTFGGYEIVNVPATSLPEELASAIGVVNQNLIGATYIPVWYVGKQLVNGTNYMLVCKEIRATRDQDVMYVNMIINVPAGSIGGEGATIVEIDEYAKMEPEVKFIFEQATRGLMGVDFRPIVYVGKQVVKGINYYFVCEAKGVYPGAEPYLVLMKINSFQGNLQIVSIEPIVISDESNSDKLFGKPLGEWP